MLVIPPLGLASPSLRVQRRRERERGREGGREGEEEEDGELPYHTIVIDCAPIGFADSMGITVLEQVHMHNFIKSIIYEA